MTFEHFLKCEGKRLESYVLRFARSCGLPQHLVSDLRQEALIACFRALPYWRTEKEEIPGGKPWRGKSAFNWCAGPMRRAMERAAERQIGMRGDGNGALDDRRANVAPDGLSVAFGPCEAETLDLHRALAADPKPAQIMRLIMTALSPASGADLARSEQVSRQAVHCSAKSAKRRLRRALG